MSYRIKLALTMLALGAIAVIIMTGITVRHNRAALIEMTLHRNEDIAEAIAIHIDNYLDELSKTTRTLAATPLLKQYVRDSNDEFSVYNDADREMRIGLLDSRWLEAEGSDDQFVQGYLTNPAAEYLKEQKTIIPHQYGEIFLTNRYGALVASSAHLTTFAHGHKYWWRECYREGHGKTFLDDRGFDMSVDDFVLGITVPVYDQGQVIGVLKSNMRVFNLFGRLIYTYRPLYEPGTVKLTRSNGQVVMEPGRKPLSTELGAELANIFDNGSRSGVYKDADGEDNLVSYAPISSTMSGSSFTFGGDIESIDHKSGNEGQNWVIVVEAPKAVITAAAATQTRQSMLIGLLAIAVLSVFTFFFVRSATSDIMNLVDLTEAVGKGNLDVQIAVRSDDEIGQLASSFNLMVNRLKETMASQKHLTLEVDKRRRAEEELKHLSSIDELTQVNNRRAFNDHLRELDSSSKESEDSLSMVMIDIDRFKSVNDSYGHDAGDSVLVELAQLLQNNIRKVDILSRWGGEEFIILMPDVRAKEAYQMAERLRHLIKDTVFGSEVQITASIGVTELQNDDTISGMIKRLDQALYKAKSAGRDNVQIL